MRDGEGEEDQAERARGRDPRATCAPSRRGAADHLRRAGAAPRLTSAIRPPAEVERLPEAARAWHQVAPLAPGGTAGVGGLDEARSGACGMMPAPQAAARQRAK